MSVEAFESFKRVLDPGVGAIKGFGPDYTNENEKPIR
jgi:hypothetical protein